MRREKYRALRQRTMSKKEKNERREKKMCEHTHTNARALFHTRMLHRHQRYDDIIHKVLQENRRSKRKKEKNEITERYDREKHRRKKSRQKFLLHNTRTLWWNGVRLMTLRTLRCEISTFYFCCMYFLPSEIDLIFKNRFQPNIELFHRKCT